MLVVHHSGTSGGTPQGFARYHVKVHGWPGIGYHYVITRDGTIWKTNPIGNISYHCGRGNRWGIGICVVGMNAFTIAQQISLDALLDMLEEAYPLAKVIAHHDVPGCKTDCPGNYLSGIILTRGH